MQLQSLIIKKNDFKVIKEEKGLLKENNICKYWMKI